MEKGTFTIQEFNSVMLCVLPVPPQARGFWLEFEYVYAAMTKIICFHAEYQDCACDAGKRRGGRNAAGDA